MSRRNEGGTPDDGVSALGAAGAASLGVGAALTAGAASACCVGPVAAPIIVGLLGASGAAWAASLKPFSPLLLGVSGLLLAFSFWSLYGRRRASCEPGERPRTSRRLQAARGVVWIAAVFWAASLGLNLLLGGS